MHLRSLLDFNYPDAGIPLDEVESVDSIVHRFKTAAMSYGALSEEAHECMAVAMNRIGGKSNTGEGGEAEDRFGTERNSAIKQVASARFGVTSKYLVSASEIQICVNETVPFYYLCSIEAGDLLDLVTSQVCHLPE